MQGTTTLAGLRPGPIDHSGPAMRVVIAEDERDTRLTLGILLRSEGFEVQMVEDGVAVMAQVEQFKPRAVLLDIGMPHQDGFTVAAELRSKLREACPVLIAVTAYATADDKARATRSGFHHHFAKPYDPLELLQLLGQLKAKAPRS